ncbi:DUF308 domain-containing protein [Roseovarius sp. SCSIO 43702]|uniref:HdeD family acid-resistance protein n=1 Tax=Roseovarius sp. SCSIO 43702 TaxID=2823043 RepID=UPI001C73B9CB|nr:DUF308 domain-containing protein [Roseovarius sp. SCSIO 43702]QYX57632.1 DUF308 domain-containing protein [Roseovarius sp. SCSIO 43702]
MTPRTLLIILGVLFLLAGLLAVFNPLAASITVEIFAAWAFLILGGLQIAAALRSDEGRLWAVLMGAVTLVLGILLLIDPLSGLVTLTILAGVAFVISGLFKLMVGFSLDTSGFKALVLISGGISAGLGIVILLGLPGTAAITLGLLLGIELLSNGAAALGLGLAARRS